jgi:SAM-dependent methyltransferase
MQARAVGDTVEIIERLLAPLEGRRILDIGCGTGELMLALAERGARVAGVDTDEAAVRTARERVPKAMLYHAGARKLPLEDAVAHAAVFLDSLHTIPEAEMLQALEEAARVVGKGGSVLVIEPLSGGSFFDALRLIEDETEKRVAAEDAVRRVRRRGTLSEIRRLEYDRAVTFPDAAAFVARAVATDPARRQRALAALERLVARFEVLADRTAEGYVLHQPMRLYHLKVPVGPRTVINPAEFG